MASSLCVLCELRGLSSFYPFKRSETSILNRKVKKIEAGEVIPFVCIRLRKRFARGFLSAAVVEVRTS
jgi:hypothetical protein